MLWWVRLYTLVSPRGVNVTLALRLVRLPAEEHGENFVCAVCATSIEVLRVSTPMIEIKTIIEMTLGAKVQTKVLLLVHGWSKCEHEADRHSMSATKLAAPGYSRWGVRGCNANPSTIYRHESRGDPLADQVTC